MTDSASYFSAVADQWDEIRAGYFTEHMRDAAIARVAALHPSPLYPNAVVADVGTGTGFVAMGLAPRAAKVYGFDASPEMLAVARRLLKVEVDLGQEQRTLVAGVAHQYAPPGLN